MARRTTEEELQDYARLEVRAGLLTPEAVLAEVESAIRAEMPGIDAAVLARAWIARARQDLATAAGSWPAETDVDRLRAVFEECGAHGVPVLQGVADHWVAKAELDRLTSSGSAPRGILWFTQADVWHAIDADTLEVNLWHAGTADAAPGDALLDAVLACFARHDLAAHLDGARIEVAARWQRRPE